jgi:hypothetical protein
VGGAGGGGLDARDGSRRLFHTTSNGRVLTMKQRGMDVVIAKSAKRKPVFKRKSDAPAMVIAVGGAPPKVAEESDETLECPECGAVLADTPENREYVASKAPADTDDEENEDTEDEDY